MTDNDIIYDKLIAFDMDSTLIQCEVIDEIARMNGFYEDVATITEEAMRGEIDFNTSYKKRLKLLKGVSIRQLEEFKENLPYSKNLKMLIMYLKTNGYRIVILSGGFDFFAKHIVEQFGLDGYKTNILDIQHGEVTGEVKGDIVNGDRKRFYLREFSDRFDVPMGQTAVVGDGANDLKMMDASACGIAFNAKPIVKEKAQYTVDSGDMVDIIKVLENHFWLM